MACRPRRLTFPGLAGKFSRFEPYQKRTVADEALAKKGKSNLQRRTEKNCSQSMEGPYSRVAGKPLREHAKTNGGSHCGPRTSQFIT